MNIEKVACSTGRGRLTGRACVLVAAVAIVALAMVRAPSTAAAQVAPFPGTSAPTPTVQLYMPDGQLKSHSLRVTPVVSWTEDGVSRTVVGEHAVTIGDVVPALA